MNYKLLKKINLVLSIILFIGILIGEWLIQMPLIFILCADTLVVFIGVFIWWHLDIQDHLEILGNQRAYEYRSQTLSLTWLGYLIRYLVDRKNGFKKDV